MSWSEMELGRESGFLNRVKQAPSHLANRIPSACQGEGRNS